MKSPIYLISLIFLHFSMGCQTPLSKQHINPPIVGEKMKGLNFVAPPSEFENNPMLEVQAVSAEWIAVIPYAYTRQGDPDVHYNTGSFQWWGERPEGVLKTIQLAKDAGLKVMLKPQVYIPGSWTGALDFSNKKNWKKWELAYEKFLLSFAEMADSLNVEVFCIGTEFKQSVVKRETFWRALIEKTKSKYKGKLTYAANWDEYDKVPFWDALDIVGINAYFPLINEKTPSVAALKKAWKPHKKAIASFYRKVKKPIVFSEFGYLSVDGCAYNTWELEAKVKQIPINEQAQANAIDALFESFWSEPYWMGGFIWKWFPNNEGHEGYIKRDYTPQAKKGAVILKKWYTK